MARVVPQERISELITDSPSWAKIGLTVHNERLCADTQQRLAQYAYSAVLQPTNIDTA
jgi:hypothetical protein